MPTIATIGPATSSLRGPGPGPGPGPRGPFPPHIINEMKAAAKRTQQQQQQQQQQQHVHMGGYSSDASDLTPNATPRSRSHFLDPTMHASLDLASMTIGGSLYSSNINSARASTVDELIEVLQGGGFAESGTTKMSGRRSIREKIAKLDVDLPSIFGGGAKRP